MAAVQVTDSSFKQDVLESELPGLGRFLGTLVWTLPNGSPRSGRNF